MSRRPFYEVPESAFLFGRKKGKPEEDVRQWVLFELLSAYNVHISDIEIEKPVKVGTRTHYADIVIQNSHVPHIVVECKRREDTKEEKGLQQAQSYADILGARIAVWTNGETWRVEKKIDHQWQLITDLPAPSEQHNQHSFEDILNFVESASPLLYWYHESVPVNQAKRYFYFLQNFFNARVHYFSDTKSFRELYPLLVAGEKISKSLLYFLQRDDGYPERNLITAYVSLDVYLQTFGLEISYKDILEMIQSGELDFEHKSFSMSMIEDLRKIKQGLQHSESIAHSLIKLLILLLNHLQKLHREKKPSPIPESLTSQVKEFVESICVSKFGVTISDELNYEVQRITKLSYKAYWDAPAEIL